MDFGHQNKHKNFSLAYYLPILGFIASVIYFSSRNYVHIDLNRHPAAVSESCKQLVNSLIGEESLPSKAFKNLKEINQKYPFDMDSFRHLRQQYKDELAVKEVKDLDFQQTPESILALAEALNKDTFDEVEESLSKISFLKRRKLTKLVKNFEKSQDRGIDDIRDLVANVYDAVLGPRFKFGHLINSEKGKAKIMARIVQEEILTVGLVDFFGKHNALKPSKKFLRRFMDSYKGKFLASMLLNLPVMYGFPPMYLPGLKRIELPQALAREILEKGLTDEMIQKINVEVLQDLKFSLPNRARYEVVRRYFMAGVGIYLSYVILEEFYEGEQIRQENIVLEEIATDMGNILEQADQLEARGINIYDEEVPDSTELSDSTSMDLNDNPFCRAINSCLQMHKDETGEEAVKGSESYKECKVFMDPENKCSAL